MNRLFIVTILCLCTTVLSAQNILRGKIIDKETGLPKGHKTKCIK